MYRSSNEGHIEQLEPFIDQGLIGEVIGLVKIGKEASVYCCRAGDALDTESSVRSWLGLPTSAGGLVAAKVYRARQYRFKNDAVYREARARELGLRGTALRAFENRKSATGREVRTGTWIHHEFETLKTLYEAGADLPQPFAAEGDVILMEFFGDEEQAASQLNRIRIPREEAAPIFQRLMNNVELCLSLNRVHGDLSPHNILYWQSDIRVIDFPQATDPRFNRSAPDLLRRDIANVCRYFAPYGVEADAEGIARDLWRRFTRAQL
jgi:RIO kinase 1